MLNNNINTNNRKSSENHHVLRKIINSAIYVEKSIIADMTLIQQDNNPFVPRKQLTASEDIDVKIPKIKRCTCSTESHQKCPCHGINDVRNQTKSFQSNKATTKSSKIQKLMVDSNNNTNNNRTKLSLNSNNNNTNKQNLINNWMVKKEQEKKLRVIKEKLLKENEEQKKKNQLEKERENFRQWLLHKKEVEAAKEKKRAKEQQEIDMKSLEKEKRQLENELSFQLWLKKKEEATLGKYRC